MLQPRMLYNSKQLWFYLHLKNHSVRIESDWFDVGTKKSQVDNEAKARGHYSDFKLKYEQAKYDVERIIVFDIQTNPVSSINSMH